MEEKELNPGAEFISEAVVDESKTAVSMGSGDMPVLASPAMVALMENAAMKCVAGSLPPGSTTVGTEINITHTRATAPGRKVTAKAVLQSVEGRRLTFGVSAADQTGIIGEGTHVRYIVDRERFMSKLD
ncbi:MAG: thioesterase family protein [Rikenellaceae bacterium]|nr:thioesterase family protein [Rikenellaceae bacterium]